MAVAPNVDAGVVAHAAAVSLSFAFKLHETSRTLHLSSFQQFTVSALKAFEVRMLTDLSFQVRIATQRPRWTSHTAR